MNYGPIVIDPETMGGTPVFAGTRVPVQSLFDFIETGDSLDDFLENFPSVPKSVAIDVLRMAKKPSHQKRFWMKILLDENMPAKVDYNFGEAHQVHTVKEMNWLGKKNGELLGLASINGFDVLITLDRNLKHQQNLNKFDLRFFILIAVNNKPETIQTVY